MYGKPNVLIVGTDTNLMQLFSPRCDTEIVSSVHFIETVLFSFVPDLLVFDSVYDVDVASVRRSSRLATVDALVLAEDVGYLADFAALCRQPRVLVCNTGIASEPAFLRRVDLLLQKKAPLASSRTACHVKQALLYMNRNAALPFTRAQLAGHLDLAEDYLSRAFKKEMGLGLWEYVLCLRLRMAHTLLMETGLPVQAVAERTGFASASYFARRFKSHFGTAPGSLRR